VAGMMHSSRNAEPQALSSTFTFYKLTIENIQCLFGKTQCQRTELLFSTLLQHFVWTAALKRTVEAYCIKNKTLDALIRRAGAGNGSIIQSVPKILMMKMI
jgi:hypothetical protein